MNHRASIQAAVEAAKKQIEDVVEPIQWMAEAQPGKINAIFLAAAVNDDEGNGVTFEGSVVGDGPSIIAALVNAMENDYMLAGIMATALKEWQDRPCNCENCQRRRQDEALNNMLNKNQN